MAGVAQGDRIRSLDIAGIMRRINALESVPEFDGPVAIAVDSGENFYIVEALNDRIQKNPGSSCAVLVWGSNGSGDGQFNAPLSVGVNGSDEIFIADSNNSRIQKFNSSGTYQSQFGSFGSGDGEFKFPRGIGIDSSDNIFVCDHSNQRVQKFNSSGTYQSQFGSRGFGNGEFQNGPMDIAIDGSGNMYVSSGHFSSGEGTHDRVQKFNSSGTYQSQFGSFGSGDGEFVDPRGIALDSSGNIFVVDNGNDRVQKFNSSGTYQSQFGSNGSGDGEFDSPVGIYIDGDDNIYIADGVNNRLQKFNSSGTFMAAIGKFGTGTPSAGTTWYRYPTTTVGDKVSAGTFDCGDAVPADTFFEGSPNRPNYVSDMHGAIENVTSLYKNAATGNAFNWTPSSADNLYHVAVTASQYDWDEDGDYKDQTLEDLIDEMDACLTELEGAIAA